MTIFGFLWLGLLSLAIATRRVEPVVFLTIVASTLQCSNVLWINGQGIGPQAITSVLFVGYICVVYGRHLRIRIRRNTLAVQLLALLLFAIAALSAVHGGVLGAVSFRLFQLMAYVFCFIAMFTAGTHLAPDFVYHAVRGITIFLLIVGAVQLCITTGILPRTQLVNELFYNDLVYSGSDNVTYFSRNNYFRILSTYMEPSYYAGFIVGSFFYFLNYKEKFKENHILLAAISVEIIFTFSSTAYGSLLVTLIIYLAFTRKGKSKYYILIGGLIGFFVLYYGFYGVLDNVIFSKMQGGSAAARNSWNNAAWRTFLANPFLGIGYKAQRASSIFYTLLAEQGIVGFVIYVLFNLKILYPVASKQKKSELGNENIGIRYAILAGVVAQLIAVPDLDICTYWMWLNLFALSLASNWRGREQRKNEQS